MSFNNDRWEWGEVTSSGGSGSDENTGTGEHTPCEWDEIKNRPFGEVETPSDTLEWDGDTTGKTCVGGMCCKVSDDTPSNDEMKDFVIQLNTGETIDCSDEDWDQMVSNGYITEDFALLGQWCIVVRKENTNVMGALDFEETGIYFSYDPQWGWVTKLETTNPIFTTTTTVPLPEKYLPELTSFKMVSTSGKKIQSDD